MRWLIRSALALSLLVFLAVAAVVMIPSERIATLAAERFGDITGRRLVIEGGVRPTFFPTLGVQTGPVSVSNADWGAEGDMLRAEGLSIALDMAALIGGEIRITAVSVQAPHLVLERARDGRVNWVFGGEAAGGTVPATQTSDRVFSLDLAEVTDGSLTFVDHGADRRVQVTAVSGAARIPDFQGAADVTLDAVLNGQIVKTQLKIAQFAPFLDGGPVGLDLALVAGAADIRFVGRGGWQPLAMEGDLTADLGDLTDISRLSGMARPALPSGLGSERVGVTGQITLTEAGSVHLRDGAMRLDDTQLSVDADLTTSGDRPNLSAQVSAGDLRLAGAAEATASSGGSNGTGATGWPTAPIDVSALGLLDTSIALTANSVDLGKLRFGPTRVVTTIDRARAVFDLRQIAAYGGTISGQFVVNGRSGLSVGGDLALSDLAMQTVLSDLAGYERLIGTGDLRLAFLGVGGSVDAIMRSLSGSGNLALGRGELRGLDVAGMLRTLDAGYVGDGQKTIFDAVTGSFQIDRGVLSNADLSLAAPYVTATGSGTVDLGARMLDYRLVPVALPAEDGTGGLRVPLLITGSWADPRFRLDLEALAREQFEEQAQEAEARAKAALERKAEQELGIVRQEGESLEDAARRRAQEALEAETGRLLERLLGGN